MFRRHRLLAEAVRRAVEIWAEDGVLSFNVIEPANAPIGDHRADRRGPRSQVAPRLLRAAVAVLGVGIGPLSGKALRIAHMGHVNAPMILGTLGALEIALVALGVAHGRGGLRRDRRAR